MDIHYAQVLASELYGVELDEDKFEELALVAYNMIGNKNCRLYRYFDYIKHQNHLFYIELPCNVDYIEAVTGVMEDWQHVTNKHWNGDPNSHWIEEYIEHSKMFLDPLYTHGKYLKYQHIGNKLYFDHDYGPIGVLYKGQILDENGLPDINDKEALAIATFIAYTSKYKEAIMTMNLNIMQVAMAIKLEWTIRCDLARTPEHISQNEMDQILDSLSSWNRKSFGKALKPLR